MQQTLPFHSSNGLLFSHRHSSVSFFSSRQQKRQQQPPPQQPQQQQLFLKPPNSFNDWNDTTTTTYKNKKKKNDKYYNDDAFGLIFLSAALVERDAVFATVFAVLSGMALIAVRQEWIPGRPAIPGFVASLALTSAAVLTTTTTAPLFSALLNHRDFSSAPSPVLLPSPSMMTMTMPSLLECGACAVSILWSIIQELQQQTQQQEDES